MPSLPVVDAATLAMLWTTAALGGALNAVAGGGSFMVFPTLLYSGVTPVVANATTALAMSVNVLRSSGVNGSRATAALATSEPT